MKRYQVSGMTCSACSSRVEKVVKEVDGVESCAVSLLTDSMTVEGRYSETALFEAVKRAGYGIGEEKKNTEKEESLLVPLLVSIVLLLALMTLSMGPMVGIRPFHSQPDLAALLQMLFSLSVLILHRRFFIKGFGALLHKSPNMDTLVALGSGVSFFYSVFLTLLLFFAEGEKKMHYLHGLYYESAAMILVLITVGKLLEANSKGKTTSAVRSLSLLAPSSANVLRETGEVKLPLSEIRIGDVMVIRPGEGIPADGVLMEGEGAVDESALTGESVPVDKKKGDKVYSGTLCVSARLLCRVEKLGEETALSRIIERVTAAGASKAPIARLADRVSGVFVPFVMAVSVLTLLIWILLGAPLGEALSYAISVLVVSCPCALGLATPVAIMVANGVAARDGILFKTAESLERAGKCDIVVLDKTGTVTEGKMQVTDLIPACGIKEDELLRVALSLEEGSVHPIAHAVLEHGRKKGISASPLEGSLSRAGFGVEGVLDGERVLGGKRELVEEALQLPEEVLERARELSEEGKTPLFFAKGSTLLGLLAVSDTVKRSSREAIGLLKKKRRVVMITGDRAETARFVAKVCGIDELYAGVLPEEKEDRIRELKKEGRVMMVGDGINDAPALTAADVGVAVGSGVEIAADASEVILMQSDLMQVEKLIRLSEKALKNIKENLFWAFCYNIVGIPLAAGLFVPVLGWRLTPMFGAAAMSVSSLLVVSNALRLNLFSEKKEKQIQKENMIMEKTMKIEGMMCPHCEAHVKKALEAVPGVLEATCSHERKTAVLRLSEDVSDAVLKETVEKEGYKVL